MKTVAGTLAAPFPYFGGKSLACETVWSALGDPENYVEPFAGSAAMLLGRPNVGKVETINDADGFVANFWRAVSLDAAEVARHVDWPTNEADLIARHSWLVRNAPGLLQRLEADPDYYDAKVAGWWCWGACNWIGSGWCSGTGPWQHDGEKLVDARQLPHLGNAGRGVNRKLPHLGDAGRGVNRQRGKRAALYEYFRALRDRMRGVRVCCGDWTRVMGGDTGEALRCHFASGDKCAVFLDPPYADTAKRTDDLYRCDSLSVAHAVREWAIKHGDDKRYRIALCGYDEEHEMPETWTVIEGRAGGGNGYGGQSRDGYKNERRERIWFSPHCLPGNAEIEIDPATCRPRAERSLWDGVPA